jgi:glucose-6-phosphate isomerase
MLIFFLPDLTNIEKKRAILQENIPIVMETIKLSIDKIFDFVPEEKILNLEPEIKKQLASLYGKTGKGNDFLGWLEPPSSDSDDELNEIEKLADFFHGKIDILVVIGIGGSYLGARAVIEALSQNFYSLRKERDFPVVLFAGQNIGEDYYHDLIEVLDEHSYAIVVISKSGTTTEPAIAFRLLKKHLEEQYGKNGARERIIAITDARKGALRKIADKEGYRSFGIPDDVGGRYSVLTPVGLVPIAIAGFDIRDLLHGARQMQHITCEKTKFAENPAALYAAARHALYQSGKTVEILVNYIPRMHFIGEWWKQLFGESEGKENKGIFPACCDFTTDLHSMGQYIQQGRRMLFETVISVEKPRNNIAIPYDDENPDDLNFIAYKPVSYVNKMAELGTMLAHVEGGVPNILLELPKINENYIGQLLYFFQKSCALSGYLLGINPFDQPGVEAYKNNMFALLGKPGFEEASKIIRGKITDK